MQLKRVQVMLEDDQHAQLKALAHRKGTSLSDLVRRMVDQGLDEQRGPPLDLLALARDDIGDVTIDPDDIDDIVYGQDW